MTEWLHFHFSLSCLGEGNGNPLQCSFLENPQDGGAWWAAIYGVAQSQTWLKRLSSSSNINRIVQYVVFFVVWCLSFSIMKFIQVVSCSNSSLLVLLNSIQLYKSLSLSIHQWMRLQFLQILANNYCCLLIIAILMGMIGIAQRKAMPKNVQTTSQLHSSHSLVK